MDNKLLCESLGLDVSAPESDILARIDALRTASGDAPQESANIRLIRAGQHEQCGFNPDGGITVTLLCPITIGKEVFSELTFRRPKMKDLKAASKGDQGNLAVAGALISALSGQAMRVIDELDAVDMEVCSVVVGFLSTERPRTGPR